MTTNICWCLAFLSKNLMNVRTRDDYWRRGIGSLYFEVYWMLRKCFRICRVVRTYCRTYETLVLSTKRLQNLPNSAKILLIFERYTNSAKFTGRYEKCQKMPNGVKILGVSPVVISKSVNKGGSRHKLAHSLGVAWLQPRPCFQRWKHDNLV